MSAFHLPWPLVAEMVPVGAAAICAFHVMPLMTHARYWEKERVCAGPQNVHIEPTSRAELYIV